jgi:hypothetical protein
MTKKDLIVKIAAVIFFAAVFVSALTPITDADFYWHLSSGEWIWTNKGLPDSDPFVFSAAGLHLPSNDSTDTFFFKSYWLSQLALYFVYSIGFIEGVILYKGLIYLLMISIIYLFLKKEGTSSCLIFLMLLPVISHSVFLYIKNWSGDRPAYLSLLFALALFYTLENLKRSPNKRYLIAAPLITLLWANAHQAVVVGVMIVLVYMSGTIYERWRGEAGPAKGQKYMLLAGLLSIAASFANPNTYQIYLAPFFSDVLLKDYVTEWRGPVEMWQQGISQHLIYIAVILALILPFIRRLAYRHLLVLLCLTLMAFSAVRHIPFLLFLSLPVIFLHWGPYLDKFIEKTRLKALLPYALVVLLTLITWTNAGGTILKNNHILLSGFYPFEAADFIRSARPEPFIYNNYSWGGFLTWKLYPEYGVFIDGRARNRTVFDAYYLIEKARSDTTSSGAGWRVLLDSCRINTIVIPAVTNYGEYYPLFGELIDDPDWQVAYMDPVSFVFLRNSGRNREIISRFRVDKGLALVRGLYQAENARKAQPLRYQPYMSLGMLSLLRYDNASALGYLQKAAELRGGPRNPGFAAVLQRLRAGDTTLRPRDILAVM